MHPELEFTDRFCPPYAARLAVFDFDGTLSLLRRGWPQIMQQLYIDYLPVNAAAGTAHAARCYDEIMALNGRPTRCQMERLAAMREDMGHDRIDVQDLHREFASRLGQQTSRRIEAVQTGEATQDDWLVEGARGLLSSLQQQGMVLALLSGTDEQSVRRECRLLGIDHFFGARIRGARPTDENFEKRDFMRVWLDDLSLESHELMAFGDGPAEIRAAHELGGLAVAIATDEYRNRTRSMDRHKRNQLVRHGAQVVMASFRVAETLLQRMSAK